MDNYEQKYKKALEAVKFLQEVNPSDEGIQNWVKDNFPELKESEDEKIRKALYADIRTYIPNERGDKYIAWLEKQREQKTIDNDGPKFHPGDWIIDNEYSEVLKVTKADANGYEITSQDGEVFNIMKEDVECNHRLWTIQDAKEGDVLSGEIDGDKYIFSFKKLNGRWIETQGVCYCETTGECIEDARFCNHYQDLFKPASKEECDVLLLKIVNHQLK